MTQNNGNRPTSKGQQADKPSDKAVPAPSEVHDSVAGDECRNSKEKGKHWVEYAALFASLIAAGGGIFAARYTYQQAELASVGNEINRTSLLTVQRAFINLSDVTLKAMRDPKTNAVESWTVTVILENSGGTATRDLKTRSGIKYWAAFEQDNPNHSIRTVDNTDGLPDIGNAAAMLGPRAKFSLPKGFITRDDERVMIENGSNMFVFGEATYKDRLTPEEHRTNFCVVVYAPLKLAEIGKPPAQAYERVIDGMDLSWGMCSLNNCADKECER